MVAYRFRMNCESSDTILKSFVTVPNGDFNPRNASGTGLFKIRVLSDFEDIPTVVDTPLKNEFLSITEYDRIMQNEGDDDKPEENELVYDESIHTLVEDEKTSDNEQVEYIVDPSHIVYKIEQQDVTSEVSSRLNITFYFIKSNLNHFFVQPSQSDTEDIIISPEEEAAYLELIDENTDRKSNCNFANEDANSDVESLNNTKVVKIKAVKTNKARLKKRDQLDDKSAGDPLSGKRIRVKRIFNEPKPMKVCDICGNQYKYQHALDSHLRRHRNDKPFICR